MVMLIKVIVIHVCMYELKIWIPTLNPVIESRRRVAGIDTINTDYFDDASAYLHLITVCT
jgi:hypothetical protein